MTSTTNTSATTNATVLATQHPSRDLLRIISILLALIGLGVASYITIVHLTDSQIACPQTATINCDVVQNSIYGHIGPLPIYYLGVLGYLVILLALLLETRIPLLQTRGRMLVFGMTLFGFLYSAFLTSIEAFVLHAWCLWCLGSAITMTVLFGVSFARVWQGTRLAVEDEEEA